MKIPILPSHERLIPSLVAKDICSVQPMTGDAAVIFEMKITREEVQYPVDGDRQHSFLYGWQRFYHGEWIAEHVWTDLKIKGL